MKKENDLILNMLANPGFSVRDFASVGLDTKNTSLEPESTYASSPMIQSNPAFHSADGKFDPAKFHQTYQVAQAAYNQLDKEESPTFSKYNIFAPVSQRNWGPQFKFTKQANPDETTRSMIRFGEQEEPTKTPEEIAQHHQVYDSATGKWLDSPEDSFWKTTWGTITGDTRVMAAYDDDVDVNGKTSKEAGFDKDHIAHRKGEYKINPDTGTYYYETLNGRNVHGKQVLHLTDILTNEDSAWNAMDFMDSDDKDKTVLGSFMKNASLVGAMFVPGIGKWITAATLIQQAANIGTTLGKIFLGSEDPTWNNMKGFLEATNAVNTRSQYAKEHTWSMENMFGLAADTFAQLIQQRQLFQYAPALFRGRWGMNEKNQEAYRKAIEAKLNAASGETLLKLKPGMTSEDVAIAMMNGKQSQLIYNSAQAAAQLENYMNKYYKTGELLSRAYMTMLTVHDIYDEARETGAGNWESALLTLGYASAEWWLLGKDIGKWVLPELRENRLLNRRVSQVLTKDMIDSMKIEAQQAAGNSVKEMTRANRLINLGKKIAFADFEVGNVTKKPLTEAVRQSAMAGLAEGTEEVSEELLSDFSKAIFNGLQLLRSPENRHQFEDTNLDNFFSADTLSRYGMNFLGGILGGSVANAKVNYTQARDLSNMDYNKAVQQVIQMERNGTIGSLRKFINQETIGSKHLSASQFSKDAQGNIIWAEATDENDSQDVYIKNLVNKQLDLIHNTIHSVGGNISDESLLDKNAEVAKNIRADFLMRTTTAGRFLQEFNELNLRAVKEINYINQQQARIKTDATTSDTNKDVDTEVIEADIKKHQDKLNEIKKEIQEYTEGSKAAELMASALLETSPGLLAPFVGKSLLGLRGFAELYYHKPYESLNQEEIDKANETYQNFLETNKKDVVWAGANNYIDISRRIGGNLMAISEVARQMNENEELKSLITNVEQIYQQFRPFILERGGLSEDAWLTKFQEFVQLNPSTLEGEVGGKTLRENIQNLFELRELGLTGQEGGMNEEDFAFNLHKLLNDYIFEQGKILIDSLVKPTETNGGIGDTNALGYVPAALRDRIIDSLQQLKKDLNQFSPSAQLDELYDRYEEAEIVNTPEEGIELPINKMRNYISNGIEAIKSLPYTPILQIADQFALDLTGENPVRVSGIMAQMEQLLNDYRADVTNFNISDDTIKARLREAIKILEMLKAAVEGARTDNMFINVEDGQDKTDVWGGINDRINLIHKNTPKAKRSSEEGSEETDEWIDLPTISGDIADMIVTDVNSTLRKLETYATLYGINQGQKLNKQNRVLTNLSYLLYRSLSKLCDSELPEGWDNSKLKEVREELTLMAREANKEERKLGLAPVERRQLQEERLKLQRALWEFFNVTNKESFENEEKLAELFSPQRFHYSLERTELLTEDLENLEDISFIWFLEANTALNPDAFYERYKEILKQEKVAPLAGQELGVFLNLANAINGNIQTRFQKAIQKAIIDDALSNNSSYNSRKAYLEKYKVESADILAATKETFELTVKNSEMIPKFSHITFMEGIPGAGKSAAVDKLTVAFLLKYFPETLQKAFVAHVSEESAEQLAQDSVIPEGQYQVFSRESLMKKVDPEWKEAEKDNEGNYILSDEDFIITDDGEIIPNYTVPETDDIPSIIIIDELSRYTYFDLYKINAYAKKYGISVITSGDLDQVQAKGKVKLPKKYTKEANKQLKEENIKDREGKQLTTGGDYTFEFKLDRNSIPSVPKLGTSMRTANQQKNINLKIAQEKVNNPEGELALHYYQRDVLRGDKILRPDQLDQAKADIDMMLADLGEGETLSYIYYDKNTPLFKLLANNISADGKTAEYKGRTINLWEGTSAQGKEGKYWVIEVNPNLDEKSYMQELYTGITRAQEASLIMAPPSVKTLSLKAVKDNFTQQESIGSEQAIKTYTEKYTGILDELVTTNTELKLEKRTPEGTVVSVGTPRTDEKPTTDETSTPTEESSTEGESTSEETSESEETPGEVATEEPVTEEPPTEEPSEEGTTDEETYGEIEPAVEPTIPEPEPETPPVDEEVVQNLIPENEAEGNNPVFTDSEVSDNYEDEVQRLTDSDNAEEHEDDDVSEVDEKMPNLLFSNATFELGGEDVNGEFRPYEHGEERQDAANGLIKLLRLKQAGGLGRVHFTTKTADLISTLVALRNLAYNTKDKKELENKIGRLLDIPGVYVRFAIINKSEYEGKNWLKFFKRKIETLLFNRGKHSRQHQVNMRNLTMIVGTDKTGDFLELPLLAINNPINLITLKEGNDYVYPDLYNAYDKALRETGSQPKAIRRLLEDTTLANRYKPILNLANLYVNTQESNTIFYFGDETDPDWTIARDLKNFGPQLNIHRGEDIGQEEMQQGDQILDLDTLNDPEIHISEIVTTTSGKIEVGGKVIYLAKPGHNVVFYSSDPNLQDTKSMEDYYVNHKRYVNGDKSVGEKYAEPKVKMAYVLPPEITVREYLESVDAFTKGDKTPPLGNINTAYKVLSFIIEKDPNFLKDWFSQNYGVNGEIYYKELVRVLDEIKRLTPEKGQSYAEQRDLLLSHDGFDFGTLQLPNGSLNSQLQNTIRLIIRPAVVNLDTGGLNWRGERQEQNIEKISQLFADNGTKLYYQSALTNAEDNRDLKHFVRIKVDPNNKFGVLRAGIADTKFKVRGNPSTVMFSTNVSEETAAAFNKYIEKFLERIGSNGKQVYSSDNKQYLNGNSKIGGLTPPNSFHPDINNIITTLGITGIEPISVNDNSIETKRKIVEYVRQNHPKRLAMILPNGDLVVSNESNIFVNSTISSYPEDGESITNNELNPKSMEAQDGKAKFILTDSEGVTYDAEYYLDSKELSLTAQQPTVQKPALVQTDRIIEKPIIQITEDNFLAWQEVINILGTKLKTRPVIKKIGKGDSSVIDQVNELLHKSTIAKPLRDQAKQIMAEEYPEGVTPEQENTLAILDSILNYVDASEINTDTSQVDTQENEDQQGASCVPTTHTIKFN